MEESTSEVSTEINEIDSENTLKLKKQIEKSNRLNQTLLSFIAFQACKNCRDIWNETSSNLIKNENFPISSCDTLTSNFSIVDNDLINATKCENDLIACKHANSDGSYETNSCDHPLVESSSVIFKIDDQSMLNVAEHVKITKKSKSLYDLSDNDSKQFFCAKWKDITCLETRYAINLFNNNHDKGANYIYKNILMNKIEEFVRVIKNCKFLCRKNVGEFLGDTRKQFNKDVLSFFVKTFDFMNKNIEEAIRLFQSTFRLPGEAQKISHILETFSLHYLDNPNMTNNSYKFANSDEILFLTYAIIMLNTDLHSANVKNKMTLGQFIKNIRRSQQLVDMTDDHLAIIYTKIKEREFHTSFDNISQLQQISKGINKMEAVDLVKEHRQFVGMYQVNLIIESFRGIRPRLRLIFLFNDLLLVAKMSGKISSYVYSYETMFPLLDTELIYNNTTSENMIYILMKNRTVIYYTLFLIKKFISIKIVNQTSDRRFIEDYFID